MSAYLANRGCGWQDEALVMIIRFADTARQCIALGGHRPGPSSLYQM